VVDLLEQHHREGSRFEPTEFVEQGPRIAVGMTVSNPNWHGEPAVDVFKVLTFGVSGQAVLMQDCPSRDDALAELAAA
jgi:hypothetical protein